MKIKNFRDVLSVVFLLFIIVWVAGVLVAVKFMGMDPIEALGLGTATGILLAVLKDIFQFYFRRSQPGENGSSTSSTSSTSA